MSLPRALELQEDKEISVSRVGELKFIINVPGVLDLSMKTHGAQEEETESEETEEMEVEEGEEEDTSESMKWSNSDEDDEGEKEESSGSMEWSNSD